MSTLFQQLAKVGAKLGRHVTMVTLMVLGLAPSTPAQASKSSSIDDRIHRVRAALALQQRADEASPLALLPEAPPDVKLAQWGNWPNWGNWGNWANWNNWNNWGNWGNWMNL
jgi:hypothetical protein